MALSATYGDLARARELVFEVFRETVTNDDGEDADGVFLDVPITLLRELLHEIDRIDRERKPEYSAPRLLEWLRDDPDAFDTRPAPFYLDRACVGLLVDRGPIDWTFTWGTRDTDSYGLYVSVVAWLLAAQRILRVPLYLGPEMTSGTRDAPENFTRVPFNG